MNKISVLLGCVFLLLSGCQEAGRYKNNVAVTTEEGGEFPQFLVGAWETNKNDFNYWRIVFESNGTISSAVIPIAEAEVKPNRRNKFPSPKGEPGFFDAGDFNVFYKPQSRELVVNIEIKKFCLYLIDGGELKGSWEFFITGYVLDDGKTWMGDLFNSPDIAVFVPDPNSPKDKPALKEGGKLQIGLGEEEGEHVIFTKVPDANGSPS